MKKLVIIFIILIIKINLFKSASSTNTNLNSNQTFLLTPKIYSIPFNFTKSNDIIFKNETPKFNMFKICQIDVLIKNLYALEDLNFISSDNTVFKYKSSEICQRENCPKLNYFSVNETEKNYLNSYTVYTIYIEAKLIGKARLLIYSKNSSELLSYYDVIIINPKRIIDYVFNIWVIIFGLVMSFLMGILLDKDSLLKIIKMPKAILIGFFCQYITMPLLAFGVANLFKLTPVESLALFIYGCSPGGAGSNNWTILFNGDLDLSAILTFVSVLSSMVMMPSWIYSLGTIFSKKAQIKIPILGLFGNLLITILPCLIGLLISNRYPKIKKSALKISKPFVLVILISFLILAFSAKFYTFSLLKLRHWISGPLIPWFGYILGGSIAWLLKLPLNQVKTIAIETGIQNIGVAFLIIFRNLPAPEADFAALPILGVATLTNIPLYLVLIITKLIKLIRKDKNKNRDEEIKTPEQDPMLSIEQK